MRLIGASLLFIGAGGVSAQNGASFPERPVRVIMSASPGASSDAQGRVLSQKLTELWGKPVIVEHITGGDGILAQRRAANAAADGHTILSSGSSLVIAAAHINDRESDTKNRGFDLETAFRGVTNAVSNPQVLIVRPGIGVKNLSEYIAYVRQKDGGMPFGNISRGGIAHIINEILLQQTKTKVNYIPYKGGGPANTELLAGRIDAVITTGGGPQMQFVREGRMLALAVSTKERARILPDVPTFTEAGMKGIEIGSWQGYFVSSKTLTPVVDKIYQGFAAALKDPAVVKSLENQGFSVIGTTPAETDKLIQHESLLFRQIIKSANITLEEN